MSAVCRFDAPLGEYCDAEIVRLLFATGRRGLRCEWLILRDALLDRFRSDCLETVVGGVRPDLNFPDDYRELALSEPEACRCGVDQ